MKSTKVISLLRYFSKKELDKFSQLIESPYFKVNPNTYRLFDYLYTHHPDLEDQLIDRKVVFEALYNEPIDKSNEHKLKNRASDLYKLLEQFLALEYFETHKKEKAITTFKALKERKADHLSFLQLNKISKLLEEQNIRDRYFYYDRFRNKYEYYMHREFITAKNKNKEDQADALLRETFKHLNHFYRIACLNHIIEAMQRNDMRGSDFIFQKTTLNHLKAAAFDSDELLTKMYEQLFEIVQTPDPNKYEQLKKLTISAHEKTSQNELTSFMWLLLNYQIIQFSKGEGKLQEFLFLYQFGIPKNLYNDGAYLHTQHFLNAVVVGCSLGELNWLSSFIEEQEEKLDPHSKKNIMNLAWAYLHFAKKEFEDALSKVSQVRTLNNVVYALPSWTLLLRCYFEISEREPYIDEQLRYFSDFISKRGGIAKQIVISNKNFIKMMRKLLQTVRKNRYTKNQLLEELDVLTPIVTKSWFTEKITNLKA